jgi:translation initiation factor 3 subunit L
MLGYFSILGLVRVHVLLGDYTLALKMLDDIDLRAMVSEPHRGTWAISPPPNMLLTMHIKVGPNTRFHSVHSAHVTVFYYVGFAYLQLRRYTDAIEFLTRGINHFGRFKRWTAGADQVAKQVDRMVALVAIAHALQPSVRLDDWIKQSVQDKYGEQHQRMLRGGYVSSVPFFSVQGLDFSYSGGGGRR